MRKQVGAGMVMIGDVDCIRGSHADRGKVGVYLKGSEAKDVSRVFLATEPDCIIEWDVLDVLSGDCGSLAMFAEPGWHYEPETWSWRKVVFCDDVEYSDAFVEVIRRKEKGARKVAFDNLREQARILTRDACLDHARACVGDIAAWPDPSALAAWSAAASAEKFNSPVFRHAASFMATRKSSKGSAR